MARLDYSLAEQKCPQKISIGKLMREAVDEMTLRDSKAT
jgi:predicted aldo/keto reductase-like oxidoreductase